jgi:phage head maturation protease
MELEGRYKSDFSVDGYLLKGLIPWNSCSRTLYKDGNSFRERLGRHCFKGLDKRNVLALYNHDPDLVLGATNPEKISDALVGKLELENSEDGLRFRLHLEPSDLAHSILDLANTNDLGVSPAFRSFLDEWSADGHTRKICSGELLELSLLPAETAAYAASCAHLPTRGKIVKRGGRSHLLNTRGLPILSWSDESEFRIFI